MENLPGGLQPWQVQEGVLQPGGESSPPSLLQMAQGNIGVDLNSGSTPVAGQAPSYDPRTTQGGYNAVFAPQNTASANGGWFTMQDYLGQAPTAMEAATNPGSMPSSPQDPQSLGNNFLSTNNWRLLPSDYRTPDFFMINGQIISRAAAQRQLSPKSVLGQEHGGPQGYSPMGGGMWAEQIGSYGGQKGYAGSDQKSIFATPTY